MRPGMGWKYNLRVGGGGAGVGMRCFPVWCSLFHFSDIFSSSMWTESSDCPGGEGGGGGGGPSGEFGGGGGGGGGETSRKFG